MVYFQEGKERIRRRKMEDGSGFWHLWVFLFLLFIEALVYGFSAAVQSVSESKLEKLVEQGEEKAKRILSLKENPTHFVEMIQVLVTLVNLILGAYYVEFCRQLIERLLKTSLGSQEGEALTMLTLLLSPVLIMYFFLSFGVLAPKKIGAKYAESWAFGLINSMYYLMKIFSPFTYFISGTTALFVRLFGINPNERGEDVTEEEIISMVNEGHEQGVLQASEAKMITNIFEFSDKEAKDIMTHRKHINGIEGSFSLKDTLNYMLCEKNSRYPVYEDDIDNITGILHLKDVMQKYQDEKLWEVPVKEIEGLIMEAKFIPKTRKIDSLFRNMQSMKIHMVIVVDEYGQTAGLIAMEDILEEIVGNIFDEHDEFEKFIIERGGHTYSMSGMTPLEEVEERLGVEFEEKEFDTLNGLLISKLNRIPEEDEDFEIELSGYSFRIQEVENKTIQWVLVKRLKEEGEEDSPLPAKEPLDKKKG